MSLVDSFRLIALSCWLSMLLACRSGRQDTVGATDSARTAGTQATPGPIAPATEATSIPLLASEGITSGSAAPPDVTNPAAPSPRPTDAQWDAAEEAANGAEPRWRPANCSMKHIREWVRVTCGPGYYDANWTSPEGRLSQDYFTRSGNHVAELIVRTGRGLIQDALMDRVGAPDDILQIVWPSREATARLYLEGNPRGPTNLLAAGVRQPIPDLAASPSTRPAEADWVAAPEVNTSSTERGFKGCSLRMIDDWVKLFCVPGQDPKYPPMIESLVGFGTAKTDFFWLSWSLKASWIEFRVQRGKTQDALLRVSSGMGALHVEWPESSPKPTVISVEAP